MGSVRVGFLTAFSDVLEHRPTCIALSAAVGTHFSLMALGLPGWQCPIRYGLGVPCPGCGLSRAASALVHGDWHQALQLHLFVPVVIVAIALILISAVLPNTYRPALVNPIRWLETHLGMTTLLLTGAIGYWLIRLLFFTKVLYQLVM